MHCRDHVEETIVDRLNRRFPDDVYVSDLDYHQVVKQLDGVFRGILNDIHIPSFTDEDLLSFMYMKTHQLLRRDSFSNHRGKIASLAYTSFRNLFRDLIQMQDRAWKRDMRTDPIDHTKGSQDLGRSPYYTPSFQRIEEQMFFLSEKEAGV